MKKPTTTCKPNIIDIIVTGRPLASRRAPLEPLSNRIRTVTPSVNFVGHLCRVRGFGKLTVPRRRSSTGDGRTCAKTIVIIQPGVNRIPDFASTLLYKSRIIARVRKSRKLENRCELFRHSRGIFRATNPVIAVPRGLRDV